MEPDPSSDADPGSTGARPRSRTRPRPPAAATPAAHPETVPETIVCVECRGTCHRLGHAPPEGYEPGDWVAYRCGDCLDRFDLEVPHAEELEGER